MKFNAKIVLLAFVCLLVCVSAASACNPKISIVKKTNGVDVNPGRDTCSLSIPVGSPITWTYDVKNTGDVKLTSVTVTDNKIGAVTCPKTTLDVGESMQCTASGFAATTNPIYKNEGKATGWYKENWYNLKAESTDKSCYMSIPADPKITVDKVLTNGLEGTVIPTGTSISWDYTVANTGNVPLTNVHVTDNKGVVVTCLKDTLAVGESEICTGSSTAVGAPYTNTGTAYGTFQGIPVTVTAQDDSSYTGTTSGGGGIPTPEFPSVALPAAFIVGFIGVVLFMKGTRENE